jgi:hypothetical protein
MEFEKQFATEEACKLYLEQLRWPEGFACPRCGGREGMEDGTRAVALRAVPPTDLGDRRDHL